MKKVLIGMLLLGGLVIFALATFYVENWQLTFGEGQEIQARFSTVNTLDEGDPVRLLGSKVGAVREVTIEPEGHYQKPVLVTLWLQPDVKLRAEDMLTIRTDSVFGGNYIYIDFGPRDAPVLQPGTTVNPAHTRVEASLGEVVAQSQATLESIDKAFEDLSALTKGDGLLGRLARDRELYDQFKGIMDIATETSQRVKQGKGVIGQLIYDTEMADRLDSIAGDMEQVATDLRDVTARLNRGEGTAGKLLANDKLYTELEATVEELRKTATTVREGDGLLPQLLADEQMSQDVEKLISNATAVSEDLKSGEGTLGKLLSEEKAYEELMAAVSSVRKSAEMISDGKGTLGRLITDDTLYRQVKALVTDVQTYLASIREQSPVITFTGSVLGAF